MKTEIEIDNEYCKITVLRDGFRMATVDFMSENNHGELCLCLTEGEACKLSADIARATNKNIDAITAHSQIRDNVSRHYNNRKFELSVVADTELPVFKSGGWISSLKALPRPGIEVEYYWHHSTTDEERVYVCTCEFDGESTSFSEVGCNSGWQSSFEEFWRPINN